MNLPKEFQDLITYYKLSTIKQTNGSLNDDDEKKLQEIIKRSERAQKIESAKFALVYGEFDNSEESIQEKNGYERELLNQRYDLEMAIRNAELNDKQNSGPEVHKVR